MVEHVLVLSQGFHLFPSLGRSHVLAPPLAHCYCRAGVQGCLYTVVMALGALWRAGNCGEVLDANISPAQEVELGQGGEGKCVCGSITFTPSTQTSLRRPTLWCPCPQLSQPH